MLTSSGGYSPGMRTIEGLRTIESLRYQSMPNSSGGYGALSLVRMPSEDYICPHAFGSINVRLPAHVCLHASAYVTACLAR